MEKDKNESLKFARSFDWQISDMPKLHVLLPLNFTLTAEESFYVRLGFIPSEMEEKWFVYFDPGTLVLHQHRSWTGYCIDQIHFLPEGAGLRATHAIVNRDPEQYLETDDETDIRRIESMIHEWGTGFAHKPHVSSFAQAFNLAMQPKYLGSPNVVEELLRPYFVCLTEAWPQNANYSEKLQHHQRISHAICYGADDHTRMPGWHTTNALGSALIKYMNLDEAYCSGESLEFLISESLAAIDIAISSWRQPWFTSLEDGKTPEILEQLTQLFNFTLTVFLGTNITFYAEKTLKDFHIQDRNNYSCLQEKFSRTSKETKGKSSDNNPKSFEELIILLTKINSKPRKPAFKFSVFGISEGSILTFKLDPTITCTVTSKNKVVFQGQTISLSRAAILALQGMGRKLTTAQGPAYWLLDNQILTSLKETNIS